MTEAQPKQPGNLLVIDDNRVNRLLLVRGLEQDGHVVAWAENGRQGMDMLRAKPYDLVLLDIEMPELDGFQVLQQMLHDPQLGDIPVIMTSASDELDRVVKCIEMGAEDFLTKPLNPVLLRARVNASLEKKRLRDTQRKLFRTFAAPEVAEELLRSGLSLSGKHVQASAMFADIRSFTSLAEKQDPADTFEMLNDYFALMFDAITNHGGTLTQMMGDGLLAVFGAPIAHTDHRLQAVRAALRDDREPGSFQHRAAAEEEDQRGDRNWHRVRHADRGLLGHQTEGHLHVRGRHGQPGGANRGAHQTGGPPGAHRPQRARWPHRGCPGGRAGAGALQRQERSGGGVQSDAAGGLEQRSRAQPSCNSTRSRSGAGPSPH